MIKPPTEDELSKVLKETIQLLIDNGDLDCEACGHKARDIEILVRYIERIRGES